MSYKKFLICQHCGNLIELITDAGVKLMCCGQPMTELIANTVEASSEKHIPDVVAKGDAVEVKVGSVEHPMLEKHYIEWIAVETTKGIQRKELKPEEKPEAVFSLYNEKAIAVYAYCNIHGLWKKEL